MNVLVLTSAKREPCFDQFYDNLGQLVNVDKITLDKKAQRKLKSNLKSVQWEKYDRVFVDLHFKNIYKQTGFLRKIEGLIVYHEDACQNYIKSSKYYGKFSKFIQKVPTATTIVTGAAVAQRLSKKHNVVIFLPKGYNEKELFDEEIERDIELGFIGRITSDVYLERKILLTELSKRAGLQILRTDPGQEYRKMLNRIKIFVSADIGLDEYMAKNFEAMACGCVVLAWRQNIEEAAIGLVDKKHLLLYSSLEEVCSHIDMLRKNTAQTKKLAQEAKLFAQGHLSHQHLAIKVAEICNQPYPTLQKQSFWEKLIFW